MKADESCLDVNHRAFRSVEIMLQGPSVEKARDSFAFQGGHFSVIVKLESNHCSIRSEAEYARNRGRGVQACWDRHTRKGSIVIYAKSKSKSSSSSPSPSSTSLDVAAGMCARFNGL